MRDDVGERSLFVRGEEVGPVGETLGPAMIGFKRQQAWSASLSSCSDQYFFIFAAAFPSVSFECVTVTAVLLPFSRNSALRSGLAVDPREAQRLVRVSVLNETSG